MSIFANKPKTTFKTFAGLAIFLLFPVGLLLADELKLCPKSLSPAVETKMLKVLDALAIARKNNVHFDPAYMAAFEELMSATDEVTQAARVALMDYYVGESTGESLVCAVALDGKKMIPLLELHSRCDIPPSHSPVERNRKLPLRKYALDIIKRGAAKAHCTYE